MPVTKIPEGDTGRIDQWLSLFTGRSRAFVQASIQKGLIKVNEQVIKASTLIKPDDIVDYLLEDTPLKLVATSIPLDILYEDADLLVINKPAGLTVHPGAGNHENTLVNALLYYGKSLSSGSQFDRPGIVHRLDKDTSGVLIVAKHNEAHHILAKAFADRRIEKIYVGLVSGSLTPEEGLIDAPIARHSSNYKKFVVDQSRGKEARTGYRVRRGANDKSLIEFQLFTGRTHQIRVHMAYLGHPLIGDSLYGRKGGKRQLLHAHSIAFDHPRSRQRIKIIAPDPIWTLSF